MADITKIQPIGDSTQYTLNARILGQSSTTAASDIGGLTWNNLSGKQSTTINDYDTPSTSDTWWYILRNRHTNTANNYYTDVAIPFNANSIYYKRVTGNTGSESIANSSTNSGWVQVLDQLNYNNYAPTKTGDGASGTWGISISGNAATATALTSNAGSSSVPIYFSGGKPVQCSTTLGVSITGSSTSCTGNAATSSSCSGHSRDALAIRELQSNNINIQTWVNTQANIHTTGDQGEMQVRRFFASDGSAPSTYALPEVDSHNLIFSIDNGTSWNRILNLDMRTNDIYTTGKYSGVWQNWSKLLTLHYVTAASDFNSYTTTGIYVIRSGGNTNYATTEGNHGVLFVMWDIGTPFQIFLGDSSINYFRKRYYSGGAWSAWFTMGAAWS